MSRWLLTKPQFLILDEPTRGIDVDSIAPASWSGRMRRLSGLSKPSAPTGWHCWLSRRNSKSWWVTPTG
ncbi:Putative sugar ABC transport system, ATP-binding protein YtfR [Cronobacter dublinensis 582]|nr:Putative sugar ABC transport system, ATP-binding protein YtfR [Cronobacter dublinensis 582]